MSMSTHVEGVRPPDETWQRMKAAYDACVAAEVPIPMDVLAFFDDAPPDPDGIVVSLDDVAQPYWAQESEGFTVQLADLPGNITAIRFYNSY